MKIGILGCSGRVGKILVKELTENMNGLTLVGGTVREIGDKKQDYYVTTEAKELFEKADVLIDFTIPQATRNHLALVKEMKKSLIIGTTGLEAQDEDAIRAAASAAPIVYSANMSVGVNVILALVEKAAEILDPEWDIEVFEVHHKFKIDAPSGTALALGKAAAQGRKGNINDLGVFARQGTTGARQPGSIGFAVSRGGDVVGEHKVTYYGEGERIEIGHISTNRDLFARGAIKAAVWTKGKPPGLYSMRDVLGL